ncbi:MAG: LysR family transcriptional regulator substrate-binding protein [Acidimicrobiales bacterium]
MLRDAELARRAVAEAADLESGHLDLVALPTLVAEPLVALVGSFRRAHPGVVVRIAEPEDADAVAAQGALGESELGLGDHLPDDLSLDGDRLSRQALHAVLPPGSALPASGRLTVARLAAFPIITTPRGTSTRRLLADALRQSEPDEVRIGVVTEHREAIVPLVLAGAGAAILPEPLARAAAALGAATAPVSPAIERDVVLVHRRGALSPAARAFRALAVGDGG